MELNEENLQTIKRACREVDYGSVTIKINKESKTFDIVIEKQIRVPKVEETRESKKIVKVTRAD